MTKNALCAKYNNLPCDGYSQCGHQDEASRKLGHRKQKTFAFIHGQKRAICSKSAISLLPRCRQADMRMRSHRLLRLDDNKSAASCQQA